MLIIQQVTMFGSIGYGISSQLKSFLTTNRTVEIALPTYE